MKMPAELKVGILIIVAAALLAVMVFFVGKFKLEPEDTYLIYFRFTRGLVKDAPVRLAGVEAGRVKALKLIEDVEKGYTKVKVKISIEKDIRLREGTIASISSLGLMGEKYVEIHPGPPEGGYIPSDGTGIIDSVDPVQMQSLLRVGEDIVKKLQQIITVANEVIATDEMKKRIKNSFLNIEKATEDIASIASDVRYGIDREKFKETVENFHNVSTALNQGIKGDNIETVARNLEVISQNLKEFSEDIKENPWKLFKKPPKTFKGKKAEEKK